MKRGQAILPLLLFLLTGSSGCNNDTAESSRSIPVEFRAEVVAVRSIASADDASHVPIAMDREPQWELVLRTKSGEVLQRYPSSDLHSFLVADLQSVFSTSHRDISGEYRLSYTWNLGGATDWPFTDFKAETIPSEQLPEPDK